MGLSFLFHSRSSSAIFSYEILSPFFYVSLIWKIFSSFHKIEILRTSWELKKENLGLNGNNNKLAFNIRYIDVNNNKEIWNLCFSFIDVILLLLDITLCSVVVVGWRLGFACSHVSLSGGVHERWQSTAHKTAAAAYHYIHQ